MQLASQLRYQVNAFARPISQMIMFTQSGDLIRGCR
jgi:hypothetical protein